MSVVQQIDSVFLYVESQDLEDSILTVTASATGTYNGSDLTNTVHKGGVFYINFTTIAATCTIVFAVQGKDPVSGNYTTLAEISLDGQTTGNIGLKSLNVYPGVVTTLGVASEYHHDSTFPRTMRVQASITATASQGGAAVTFTTGLSKVV